MADAITRPILPTSSKGSGAKDAQTPTPPQKRKDEPNFFHTLRAERKETSAGEDSSSDLEESANRQHTSKHDRAQHVEARDSSLDQGSEQGTVEVPPLVKFEANAQHQAARTTKSELRFHASMGDDISQAGQPTDIAFQESNASLSSKSWGQVEKEALKEDLATKTQPLTQQSMGLAVSPDTPGSGQPTGVGGLAAKSTAYTEIDGIPDGAGDRNGPSGFGLQGQSRHQQKEESALLASQVAQGILQGSVENVSAGTGRLAHDTEGARMSDGVARQIGAAPSSIAGTSIPDPEVETVNAPLANLEKTSIGIRGEPDQDARLASDLAKSSAPKGFRAMLQAPVGELVSASTINGSSQSSPAPTGAVGNAQSTPQREIETSAEQANFPREHFVNGTMVRTTPPTLQNAEIAAQGMASRLADASSLRIAQNDEQIRHELFADTDEMSDTNIRDLQPASRLGGGDKMPPSFVLGARFDLAAQVRRHLSEVIRVGADQSVEIQMNPEELGKVKMRLSGPEGGLVVSIATERPETADLMRKHLDQLTEDFRAIGYESINFAFEGFAQGEHGSEAQDNPELSGEMIPEPEEAILLSRYETTGVDIRL